MKNTIALILLFVSCAFAVTVPGVMNFFGSWQTGTMYHNTPILHTNKIGVAAVLSNNHLCMLQNESIESATVLPESAPTVWSCT